MHVESTICALWRQPRSILLAALALNAVACQGAPGSPSTNAQTSGGASAVGGAASAGASGLTALGGASGMVASGPGLPPASGKRLTSSEYLRSVSDLFGQDFSSQTSVLPEDAAPNGFRNDTASLLPSASRTFAIEQVAWYVAEHVSFQTLSAWAPCTNQTAECQRGFVTKLGRLAFRRPLTTAEVDNWVRSFATAAAEGDGFEQGTRLVVAGFLQSPYFQFRLERVDGPTDSTGQHVASNYELATRLSYLLWGSAPDASLLDRAAQGTIDQPGVDGLVTQMLTGPHAHAGLGAFVEDWLTLYRLNSMVRDPKVFPTYTPDMAPLMKAEVESLFDRITFTESADLRHIFTDTRSALDPKLAPLYGVAAADVQAKLSANGGLFDLAAIPTRGGVLSMPGYIASQNGDNDGSIVKRGLFVLRALTCRDVPPPPSTVATNLDAVPVNLPQRERLDIHTKSPVCQACHGQFDGMGEAFEPYDAVGVRHTIDAYANPVRGDGTFNVDGADHAYADLREFQNVLAQSESVRACIAQRFVQYAYGRKLGAQDAGLIRTTSQQVGAAGNTYQAMVRAVAVNPVFRQVVDAQGSEQ